MSKPPINLNFQPTQKKVRFYTDDGVLGRRIVTTFQGRPIVLDVYGNPTVATDDVSILAVFKKMLSEYSLTEFNLLVNSTTLERRSGRDRL